MNELKIVVPIFLCVYPYARWRAIKKKQRVFISEKTKFWDLCCLRLHYILLIVAFILLITGITINHQMIEKYEQSGIYLQGEIMQKGMTNMGIGYWYTIQISKGDKKIILDVWSSDNRYKKYDLVNGYYCIGADNPFAKDGGMLEGEKSSEKGDIFLNLSAELLVLAGLVYGHYLTPYGFEINSI